MSSTAPAVPLPSPSIPLATPGPRGLPLLGNLPDLAGDRLGFFRRNFETYGDVVRFRAMGREVFQLNHPALIETVLVTRHHHFLKDDITRSLEGAMGKGLVTSEGELWRHQRKLIAPAFQPRHLDLYARAMVQAAQDALPATAAGSAVDVHALFSRITLQIVTRTLFGNECPPEDLDAVGRLMQRLMVEFERVNFGWKRIFGGGGGRTVEALDQIVMKLVQRQSPIGDSLVSRLLAAAAEEGVGLSLRQLRDEAVTLFLAGHETTAVALSYASWLLAQHPEVADRLRTEAAAVFGDAGPSASASHRWVYFNAVVREAMRLFPPVWAVGREVVSECRVGDWTLPAGASVVMPQWVVHRDPRWFEAPEAFRPERWLDGSTERLPAFAYFPFGGGPRVCVGNHFAMMEAILVLAVLVQRFELRPVPGYELEMVPAVTLRPKRGLLLDLRPRDERPADGVGR